ncbi:MAG TPA: hypothetical protein PK648_10630, partial [Verrucomicrobiales bacterium]|nr:hypothetical protein [Verrucomicrobiales bacterium]
MTRNANPENSFAGLLLGLGSRHARDWKKGRKCKTTSCSGPLRGYIPNPPLAALWANLAQLVEQLICNQPVVG